MCEGESLLEYFLLFTRLTLVTFPQAKTSLCTLHTQTELRAETEEVEEAMEVCSEGGPITTPLCGLPPGPSGLNVQAQPFCPRQVKGEEYVTSY